MANAKPVASTMPSNGNASTPGTFAFAWNRPAIKRFTWYMAPMTAIAVPNTYPSGVRRHKQHPGDHERRDEQRRVDRQHEVEPVGRDVGHQLTGDREADREEYPEPAQDRSHDRAGIPRSTWSP